MVASRMNYININSLKQDLSTAKTYEYYLLDKGHVVDRRQCHRLLFLVCWLMRIMASFLRIIYWLPKLHKIPYKSRFIDVTISNIELFILLTYFPHALKKHGDIAIVSKRSNIITSQLQSQFQRILHHSLCVVSQIKDVKHNRWDFHSVARIISKGRWWGLGYCVSKISFFPKLNHIWCVSYSHEWDMQSNFLPRPRALGRDQKVRYH